MIVYSAKKQQFVDDVRTNVVHEKILTEFRRNLGRKVGESEIASWRNSMQFMESVVSDPEIPADAGVSIEYNIPLTNNRVDFILTGKDHSGAETAVIIELKQWSKVSISNKDAIVSTALGGGIRETSHPSKKRKRRNGSLAKLLQNRPRRSLDHKRLGSLLLHHCSNPLHIESKPPQCHRGKCHAMPGSMKMVLQLQNVVIETVFTLVENDADPLAGLSLLLFRGDSPAFARSL